MSTATTAKPGTETPSPSTRSKDGWNSEPKIREPAHTEETKYIPAPAKVQALVRAANEQGITVVSAEDFRRITTRPRRATITGHAPRVGKNTRPKGSKRTTGSGTTSSGEDPEPDLRPRRCKTCGADISHRLKPGPGGKLKVGRKPTHCDRAENPDCGRQYDAERQRTCRAKTMCLPSGMWMGTDRVLRGEPGGIGLPWEDAASLPVAERDGQIDLTREHGDEALDEAADLWLAGDKTAGNALGRAWPRSWRSKSSRWCAEQIIQNRQGAAA